MVVWAVKSSTRFLEVLPKGTTCEVDEIVPERNGEFYIKIKNPKDAFNNDVQTPKRPIYSGRRFMVTGECNIHDMIRDI